MLKFIFSFILGLLLLGSQPAALLAQTDAADDNEEDTQQIQNDEGYGKDDAEYYSSESDNTAVTEEGPNTTDDEAVNEGTDTDTIDEGNAADMPSDGEQ